MKKYLNIRKHFKLIAKILCYAFILSLLLVIFLLWCVNNILENETDSDDFIEYETDYEEIYGDFLSYSLGDYTVKKNSYRLNPDRRNQKDRYIYWGVSYKDVNGDEQYFGLGSLDKPLGDSYTDAANFGAVVRRHATWNIRRYISSNIEPQYFPSEKMMKPDRVIPFQMKIGEPTETDPFKLEEYYKQFIDAKTGVQLRSIPPQELINDWGCSIQFQLETSKSDEYYDENKENFEAMVREAAEYMKQNITHYTIEYKRNYKNEIMFEGIYDRIKDEFKEEPVELPSDSDAVKRQEEILRNQT